MSRMHHVQIVVAPGRTAAVVAFYELLGLRLIDKPIAEGVQRAGAWFVASDGGQVHISERPDVGACGDRHCGLVVDDYDAVLLALAEAGHQVERRPALLGTRRCFAYDPDGNAVEVIEDAGDFASMSWRLGDVRPAT